MEHHLTRVRQIYVSMAKAAQGQQDADTLTISQVRAELQASKAATLDAQGKLAQIVEESEARVQSAESAMVLANEESQKEILFLQGALREAQESREQSTRLATLAERTVSEAEIKITEFYLCLPKRRQSNSSWQS